MDSYCSIFRITQKVFETKFDLQSAIFVIVIYKYIEIQNCSLRSNQVQRGENDFVNWLEVQVGHKEGVGGKYPEVGMILNENLGTT